MILAMNRFSARAAFASVALVLCVSLTAGTHRAATPPANEVTDALGIGLISGASVTGVAASVQGSQITLNTGGAPPIVFEASTAKVVTDKGESSSVTDIKPGTRITAFISQASTQQPSSVLRAQLITIEALPDLEVVGTVDSIDPAHSRLIVLGIGFSVDSNTGFGSTFPTFVAIKGLSDIVTGQVVGVTARFSNGTIVATRVQIISPTIRVPVILLGTVKSIGPTAWVLTNRDASETTVSLDSRTKIVGDPKVGDSVQVLANLDSSHNYLATAIVKVNQIAISDAELHGTVKSISTTQWVIGGPSGSLTADFLVKIVSTTVIYPDPKVGDRVVVVGRHDSSGSVTATKIGKDN